MSEPLLQPDQIDHLGHLQKQARTASERQRAQLLLLYHAGHPTAEVAAAVGLSPGRVRYWRRQFQQRGLAIFPGRQPAEAGNARPSPAEPAGGTGVRPDDPMAEAGRKVLAFHYAEFLAREPGTHLGKDIEELHKMRVATRRMRATIDLFEGYFRRQAIQPHRQGLRAAARALGQVRDLDVFIQKAEAYLEGLPAGSRDDLEPLLSTWAKQRARARKKMVRHLTSKGHRRFRRRFEAFLEKPGAGVPKGKRRRKASPTVQQVVPGLIQTRLEAVHAYDALVSDATAEQLHALRIDFKRLRYTLEFFQDVLGPEAEAVIDELKTIQDHLGDLNDADIACRLVGQFLTDQERQQATRPISKRHNLEPVVQYLAAQYGRRHKLLVTFPKMWERFQGPKFNRLLQAAVAGLSKTSHAS